MERLLAALGNPERQLPPVIHVAGTNGKGSTIAFCARCSKPPASACMSIPRRIWCVSTSASGSAPGDGKLVSDDALSAALDECERVNAGEPITVFEITTAAAFCCSRAIPPMCCCSKSVSAAGSTRPM